MPVPKRGAFTRSDGQPPWTVQITRQSIVLCKPGSRRCATSRPSINLKLLLVHSELISKISLIHVFSPLQTAFSICFEISVNSTTSQLPLQIKRWEAQKRLNCGRSNLYKLEGNDSKLDTMAVAEETIMDSGFAQFYQNWTAFYTKPKFTEWIWHWQESRVTPQCTVVSHGAMIHSRHDMHAGILTVWHHRHVRPWNMECFTVDLFHIFIWDTAHGIVFGKERLLYNEFGRWLNKPLVCHTVRSLHFQWIQLVTMWPLLLVEEPWVLCREPLAFCDGLVLSCSDHLRMIQMAGFLGGCVRFQM